MAGETSSQPLSARERQRYARHLVLPHIGEDGQERLKAARVLVVGVGGLGSASALYLAGAGVGRIGLIDDDVVSLSNLQRQVLYDGSELGRSKVAAAASRLQDLNADIEIVPYNIRFTTENGRDVAKDYDLIVDGTDNFQTRYDINEACLSLGLPYVYGAIFRMEGQMSLLCSGGPCYRCLFPEPPAEPVLTGEQAGILGAVPGTIGTLQATEAVKWIVGFGQPLVGRLLVYDAAVMRFDEVEIQRDPHCPACGGSTEVS
jgi:molybdopterin/thiamine biosynthesis adenylyltransferase